MDGIQVTPKKAQLRLISVALGILCGLSLCWPAAGLVCALLTPLFACPVVKRREEWLGWAAAAAPAVGAVLHGFDPVLGMAFCLPALLPLALARLFPIKERIGSQGICYHCAATALGLCCAAACLNWRLGGPLAQLLPPLVTDVVRRSQNPGLILYRLASAGLVSVPRAYTGSELLMHLLEPGLIHQMLLSLERTVELLVQTSLPSAFVSSCLLVGVFTVLRVEHLNGVMLVVEQDPHKPAERKTHVIAPPGFRLLALTRGSQIAFSVMLLLGLLLPSGDSLTRTLSAMCYAAAYTAFSLTGCAVIVFRFTQRRPDQAVLGGILAGAVFVLIPLVPFVLGMSDQWFQYRAVREADLEE